MGIQIHDYFAGRRPWGQFERLLYRLPRHSHYKAALDDDEEYAAIALQLSMGQTEGQPRVPLAGYSEVVARLDNLFDAVTRLNDTIVSVYSRRGQSNINRVRAPRPVTAQQRLQRAQSMERLHDIEQRMTGGR